MNENRKESLIHPDCTTEITMHTASKTQGSPKLVTVTHATTETKFSVDRVPDIRLEMHFIGILI